MLRRVSGITRLQDGYYKVLFPEGGKVSKYNYRVLDFENVCLPFLWSISVFILRIASLE